MAAKSVRRSKASVAVDLFCGAGGLTRGLLNSGIQVAAGYDIDDACQFPFEFNNPPAKFYRKSVVELEGQELSSHFGSSSTRILVGCAPCVTFSRYAQRLDRRRDPKWSLLKQFARLVREVRPDIVSMENVPELQHHSIFQTFLSALCDYGFHVGSESSRVVYCPDFGIPQHRNRLVILASRLGPIELLPPTHSTEKHRTVADALRALPKLKAGEQCRTDPMHRASGLSSLNLRRIRHSEPGGTWRDWPRQLVADCHRKLGGKTYPSVYGRMEWDRPSPTVTTQFYGFGNGRFGHPDQDRALSLREGAILQSFPETYAFVAPGQEYSFKTVGRMIGNMPAPSFVYVYNPSNWSGRWSIRSRPH